MKRRLLIGTMALALIGVFARSLPSPALAVGCGGSPADLGSAQTDDRELWRVTTSDGGNFLTTLVSDETIVVSETTRGCVLAITSIRGIDTATGKDRWVAPSDQFGRVDNAPVGIADVVYVVSSAGRSTRTPVGHWLSALDAATGTTRWTTGLDDSDQGYYQVAGGDAEMVTLIGGGNGGAQILAVEAATGAIRWSVPVTGFVRATMFDSATGSVYAVNGSVDGGDQIARLNKTTGEPIWMVPVLGGTTDAAVDIVTARETGIVVAVEGQTSFLASEDGATIWDEAAPSGLGDGTHFQYWTTDDTLIENTIGREASVLTARNLTDGSELWTTDLTDTDAVPYQLGPNGVVTAGDTLLFGTSSDRQIGLDGVMALDLATGETTWTASFPATTNYSSSTDVFNVADNEGGSGNLHALSAANGGELWTIAFPDLSDLRIAATSDRVVYVGGTTATDVTLVAVKV